MLSHQADALVNINMQSHHTDALVNINVLSHHADALVNINKLSTRQTPWLISRRYPTMRTPWLTPTRYLTMQTSWLTSTRYLTIQTPWLASIYYLTMQLRPWSYRALGERKDQPFWKRLLQPAHQHIWPAGLEGLPCPPPPVLTPKASLQRKPHGNIHSHLTLFFWAPAELQTGLRSPFGTRISTSIARAPVPALRSQDSCLWRVA
ncbi:unnamed protein product [Rangifer tarandus platyrhynchus]|uniref:Uncharacterized protein n=1 Tax=Rangifer tarandus platyrhynchus TaxID=3082113 RepID=A0AC59YI27_RANTA